MLLLIGGAALYAELQSPGIGLGGLISALCFLLYFWLAYLGGTAGWLEVLLFLAGMVCLLLEVFVLPGVGVFGLAGGLLVISSLVLASQTFVLPRNAYQMAQVRNSLLLLTTAGAGVVVLAVLINRYLPHAPMFNRMMLAPPTPEEMSVINQARIPGQLRAFAGHPGDRDHAAVAQRQGPLRRRNRRCNRRRRGHRTQPIRAGGRGAWQPGARAPGNVKPATLCRQPAGRRSANYSRRTRFVLF